MTDPTIPTLETEAFTLIQNWLAIPENVARLTHNKNIPIANLSSGKPIYLVRTTRDELRARIGGSFETKYVGRWGKDHTRISGGGRWWLDELQAKNNLRSLLGEK